MAKPKSRSAGKGKSKSKPKPGASRGVTAPAGATRYRRFTVAGEAADDRAVERASSPGAVADRAPGVFAPVAAMVSPPSSKTALMVGGGALLAVVLLVYLTTPSTPPATI